MQDAMLKEVVVEKEIYDATKKARRAIDRMLAGLPMEEFGTTYGSFDAPLEAPLDEPAGEVAVQDPMTRRHLGELQPETLPSDDVMNPFPGLERPLG